jgi:hypothetical protein
MILLEIVLMHDKTFIFTLQIILEKIIPIIISTYYVKNPVKKGD